MNYYHLKCGLKLVAKGPLKVDGDYFGYTGPRPYQQERVSAVVPNPDYEDRVVDDHALTDFISFGGIYFCISVRVHGLLKSLHCDPQIKFIPTDIRNQENDLIGNYFYVWSPNRHEVVDHEKASVKYYRDSKIVADVLRMALDTAKVPAFDLFCAEASTWIATERVREAFEANNITNVSWNRIT